MLALSSLSKSSRYVAILYAAVIFFTQAIYGVMYAVTRSSVPTTNERRLPSASAKAPVGTSVKNRTTK